MRFIKRIVEALCNLGLLPKVVDDDFGYELHLWFLVLSWDIINDWVLFLKVRGAFRYLADITPVMTAIETIGNHAIVFLLGRIGVVAKPGQWNIKWPGKRSLCVVRSERAGPVAWEFGWTQTN